LAGPPEYRYDAARQVRPLALTFEFYQMLQEPMMNRSLRISAVVCALSATFAAPAWANPFESTLPNGMKLIVKEDRRAPSVVHMVW